MKKTIVSTVFLCTVLILSGCQSTELAAANSLTVESSDTMQDVSEVSKSEMFSNRDMEIGYDEENSVWITLSGNSASCNSNTVDISDNVITITEEGTYILSGMLNDGTIVVSAEDTDKVQLVLDNAEISSSTSAAIYVQEADKVVVTTSPESVNLLSNTGKYVAIDENNIDAVIFSRADLTLNGTGTLTVDASEGHGIVSKDDLVFTSGNYEITAADHGISGKDSVRIANGNYTIKSGKDGIHAENKDDASLGFLYIANGTFSISAKGDGMSAGTYLQVDDGEFTIDTGSGSADAPTHSENNMRGFRLEEMPPVENMEQETEESVSTKGLKASAELRINGGKFVLDTEDDAFHSNGDLTIHAGDITISSGDDGIHADGAVEICSGNIDIIQSYEGIEGLSVDISGGNISLTASDDGVNAAGGNDSSGFGGRGGDRFGVAEGASITISDGILHVNASGDGLDSNGSLIITGGETYVCGSIGQGDGALDFDGEGTISGGILVAAGSSGMLRNFGDSSTQGVIMTAVPFGVAGSTISLSDSAGNELVSWQPDKEYRAVMISCPGITAGSTYSLSIDEIDMEITMDSLIYGTDDAGGSGGMKGNRGNRQGLKDAGFA